MGRFKQRCTLSFLYDTDELIVRLSKRMTIHADFFEHLKFGTYVHPIFGPSRVNEGVPQFIFSTRHWIFSIFALHGVDMKRM